MPWLASSQTLSNEEYCTVPCRTLKNALLVKADRDFIKGQLVVTRDSISILNTIVSRQDSLLTTQDSIILLYKENEGHYIGMLDIKNEVILIKDKQIRQEKVKALAGWVVAILNTTFLVIKLI
jgi:hypothetical protein